MSWLTLYAVVGICVAALAVVVSDRRRAVAPGVSLFAGVVWPILLIALLQLTLWVAAVRTTRASRQRTVHSPTLR